MFSPCLACTCNLHVVRWFVCMFLSLVMSVIIDFDYHRQPAQIAIGLCFSGSLPFYVAYVWCCHWLSWQIYCSLSLCSWFNPTMSVPVVLQLQDVDDVSWYHRLSSLQRILWLRMNNVLLTWLRPITTKNLTVHALSRRHEKLFAKLTVSIGYRYPGWCH